jgi:hypothetical protein
MYQVMNGRTVFYFGMSCLFRVSHNIYKLRLIIYASSSREMELNVGINVIIRYYVCRNRRDTGEGMQN